MTTAVHVVSKTDNAKHAVCNISQESPALAPSSVRARTHLISLTSNNLTYARSGGPPLYWWDVYPVPEACPPPFNDRDEWCIVPAWGYGFVTESTIGAIQPGSLLWGMWPASGHEFDLRLEAGEPAGHWKETSEHRGKLMTVYNRYEQTGSLSSAEMQIAGLCKTLWAGPSLLNSSTFSSRRIHPFGFGEPWSAEDAQLSSTVILSLSASSKTGRSFFWELARNRDSSKDGPLGLLQLTSAPETLPSFDTPLPVKAATYTDAQAPSWIGQFNPSRVLVVDFGASDAALQTLLTQIRTIVSSASITVLGVGYENKIYSSDELKARLDAGAGKVRLNTSGLRDQAIKVLGAEEFFGEADETWKRCVADKTFDNIDLTVLTTVQGRHGIEGAWDDLCNRKVPPTTGLLIDLSH
ncbi:hypothetical protein NLG97_g9721 [Lecanicillium saksenae]|uniref:Uncharacterized protein n=1 Tax=Lecanicillium saksenae TaxID=468837 RepID=A0ACC1QIG8_9HYPO|nr:hypothetical protein NLG97_g9721 [Lecanicillium saksenae]